MIRVKGRGVVYGELWHDEEPRDASGVDILVCVHRTEPFASRRSTPFLSLVADLTVDEGDIARSFDETCRYQIRRAETKDSLRIESLRDPASRLEEFGAFFNAFAVQKSLAPADPHWLRAACHARQLALTCASGAGEALVWHAYVLTDTTATLLHSGSRFRERDAAYRSLVGRANRLLHWKDMLWFRGLGMARYDWGGLFEDEATPERAGINRFKKSFGGQVVRSFDCAVPLTLRGRIYLPLRDAWRRLRSAPVLRHGARWRKAGAQ